LQAVSLPLAIHTSPAPDLTAELLAIRQTLEQSCSSNRTDTFGRLAAARGIERAAATSVVRAMHAMSEGEATDRLRATLLKLIEVAPWPLAATGRTLIAAVGPTGVGKTTTIAKLAAHAVIDKKTVTLVTCDTFRVGAVEQIKRYARLLDVRHEVARDASELAAIITASKSDVILVDTPGRPFREDGTEGLLAPRRFAMLDGSVALSRHVLLCMSASVRWIDAVRTAKAFSAIKPVSIAVTMIDECDVPAGLVHATLAAKLPLSILCTGPRVPEDIEFATSSTVSLLQATARLSTLCIGTGGPSVRPECPPPPS